MKKYKILKKTQKCLILGNASTQTFYNKVVRLFKCQNYYSNINFYCH